MARSDKKQIISVDQPGIYRFKVQGRLSATMLHRFEELAVSVAEDDQTGCPITTFTGRIADQAALHGMIARIRDLGLPLLLIELVSPIDPGG